MNEYRLFTLLEKILQRLKVDYITEQGVSGIWTYRKWNSGIAECWGSISFDVTEWHAWGNVFASAIWKQVAYPFTFIEAPKVTIEYGKERSDAWAILCSKPEANRTPQMQLVRPANGNLGEHTIFLRAIGRWKESSQKSIGGGIATRLYSLLDILSPQFKGVAI